MLFNYCYVRVKNLAHLGDMIGIVQYFTYIGRLKKQQYYLFSNHICSCCKRSSESQLCNIVSLIDTTVKVIPFREYEPCVKQIVPWCQKKYQIKYVKANSLPQYKKDYITVQLTPSSDLELPSRKINYQKVVNWLQGYKIINLGDKEIKGTEMVKGTIVEKLNLIGAAKLHISVDSGMAHLASMTNTPTIVICPRKYWNRYLYQDNVSVFDSVFAAIKSVSMHK